MTKAADIAMSGEQQASRYEELSAFFSLDIQPPTLCLASPSHLPVRFGPLVSFLPFPFPFRAMGRIFAPLPTFLVRVVLSR